MFYLLNFDRLFPIISWFIVVIVCVCVCVKMEVDNGCGSTGGDLRVDDPHSGWTIVRRRHDPSLPRLGGGTFLDSSRPLQVKGLRD